VTALFPSGGLRPGSAGRPLTGAQKVAVVLMQMSQEAAAQVLSRFTEHETEEITAEIVRLDRIDPSVVESVVGEFHQVVVDGRVQRRGGQEVAASLLEASLGAERAAGVLQRLETGMAGKPFEFLDEAEPGQVVSLLDGELPQTIALVLAHLRASQASAVLAGVDAAVRTEVAQAIATMGTATPEAVAIVASSLRGRAGAVVARRDIDVVGGVQPLVEIINLSDVATERALLEELDERAPQLAEEVRSRMLTFEDVVKLETRDVQQVLRGIDVAVLAMAMKGADPAVTDVIRGNVSERNRALLDDEVAALGPVRRSAVEEARAEVVRAVRELEAAGEITVHRAEEDALVE